MVWTLGRPAVFRAGAPFCLSAQLHPCHCPPSGPYGEEERQAGWKAPDPLSAP